MTEQPFDPEAAERLSSLIDAWQEEWEDYTEPRPLGLRVYASTQDIADLREVRRQLAYAKNEAALLAEKCAAWRGQYEETRAKLEAVRAAANEWHQFAVGDGREIDPNQVAIAGHALAQVLSALDGARPDSEDGEPA